MLDGLAYVEEQQLQISRLLVLGYSELVVNFLLCRYKPQNCKLITHMQHAQELQQRQCHDLGMKLEFQYISRVHNTWADWLVGVSQYMHHDIDLDKFAELWPTNAPAPKSWVHVFGRCPLGIVYNCMGTWGRHWLHASRYVTICIGGMGQHQNQGDTHGSCDVP